MLTRVTITRPRAEHHDALAELREALAAVRLPFDLPGAVKARRTGKRLGTQLADYVLPRVRRPDGPFVVVVGGSTGTGKSTLVNSLLRAEVTEAGVLRPTTRTPVLVAHPADLGSLTIGGDVILPGLTRTSSPSGAPETVVLLDHGAVPRDLALLDAPDLNSVVAENRALGERLMDAADGWLFVTSAERYADVVPWRVLQTAKQRRPTMAIVLNRVPPEVQREVREACAALLAVNGLGNIPLFVLPETVLTGGLLPEYLLAPIHEWLRRPAQDSNTRIELMHRTLDGVLDSLPNRVALVADAVAEQADAVENLHHQADRVYDAARTELHNAIDAGELFRGDLLVRWQETLAGEGIRALVDTSTAQGRKRPAGKRARNAATALRTSVAEAPVSAATTALAEAWNEVAATWAVMPGGDLVRRAAPDYGDYPDVSEPLREWSRGLPDLIRRQVKSRRMTDRYLAGGHEGPAVLIALGALAGRPRPPDDGRRLAPIDDLTYGTGDPPRAGESAAEAVFAAVHTVFGIHDGDRLLELARTELVTALGAAFDAGAQHHRKLLADLGVRRTLAGRLRDAQNAVQRTR